MIQGQVRYRYADFGRTASHLEVQTPPPTSSAATMITSRVGARSSDLTFRRAGRPCLVDDGLTGFVCVRSKIAREHPTIRMA